MKQKAAKEIGLNCNVTKLPEDSTEETLTSLLMDLNNNREVDGVLVQLPLPSHLDEKIVQLINPEKDVDGFHAMNVGELVKKNGKPYFVSCTPRAVIELLKETGVEIRGKRAVVIGRSNVVGMPVFNLLVGLDATVTVCHSRTVNIAEIIHEADIVVAAIGKPGFISADWIKPGAIVIDVGINAVPDASKKNGYKLVGDVDPRAQNVASFMTPVPGGVGPMTVMMLMQNTVESAERKASRQSPRLLEFKTPVPSDTEISQRQIPKHIHTLGLENGLRDSEIAQNGLYKAKVKLSCLDRLSSNAEGKYIVVTGINPTPLGEGKSVTTVGLSQAFAHLGKTAFCCIRQPSQGPTFGIKGGAAGGGYSQVIPMDEFNLHLNGDIHAITAANNLLAAAIDARMFHENTQTDSQLFNRLCPLKNGKRVFGLNMKARLDVILFNQSV